MINYYEKSKINIKLKRNKLNINRLKNKTWDLISKVKYPYEMYEEKKTINLDENKELSIEVILNENIDYKEAINTLVVKDSDNNKKELAYTYYRKGLQKCFKNGDYYYCINKKDTEEMIEYMTKAKDLHFDEDFGGKISWGKKMLEKKFDKSKWGIFIYPALLLISGEILLVILGLIIATVVSYLLYRPNYEIVKAEILNEKGLYYYTVGGLHLVSSFFIISTWGIIKKIIEKMGIE